MRKKRRRVFPLVISAISLVIIIAAAAFIYVRFIPTSNPADLQDYYKLDADQASGRSGAAADEMAIVLRDLPLSGEADDAERDRLALVISDYRAVAIDERVYVPREVFSEHIDERFYFDDTDGCLIVTNALNSYTAYVDATFYYVNMSETVDVGYPIVVVRDGSTYIALDFATEFSSAYYRVYEDPARIVIDYISEDADYCTVTKDAAIRQYGGIKSDVIGNVVQGAELQVKRTLSGWLEVISEDGYVGYISDSSVSDVYTKDEVSDYEEPEYTSLTLGKTVKMAWMHVTNSVANADFESLTANSTSLNVVSPTWYSLSSASGDVEIISSAAVVEQAHAKGYLVWAFFGDVNAEYSNGSLSSTQKRRAIIDTVMSDMSEKGIDGINVDFENFESDYGEDFIQFIRELSIRCRSEGKYLSVDNYAPYSIRDYYHMEEQGKLCDYVLVMEYDDYVGTDEEGPNSSLPFIREVTDLAVQKVAAEKLIIGIPFYCRFWSEDSAGELSNRAYGITEAWQQVQAAGATPVWDSELGVYAAQYADSEGNTVYAYLENAETIEAKLSLLKEYSVAGFSAWRLGQESSDIWAAIAQY